MEQDRQSSFEANENGSKLAGTMINAMKEESRPDKEAVHDSDNKQTHLDAQVHYNKAPRHDKVAVHDSCSQLTHLDAQAHYDNAPCPDEEAGHDSDNQQTHLDTQAHYDNAPCPDEEAVHDSDNQQTHLDAQAHYNKAPRPDEESVHDNYSQQTYLDTKFHYDKKPHLGKEARYDNCENECDRREKNNNIRTFKEPHPDEKAGLDHNEAHFDKGWAWVVLATTFLMEFFVGGLITSSGVIYAALIDEFNKSRAETAWVSSLAVSTYYLFSPLGAILSERYGCWVVALLGTLACSIGLLSSSFVTSLPMLYLTYSFLWGMGASLVYFADLLILTKYFKARLAFANGIMALGGAIGGSVLSPTMQQLFIHVGLANMFRVLSVAFLILSGFALVYRPKRSVRPQNGEVRGDHEEKKCMFDWEILRNKAFLMWIAVIFIFMLGYMVPFVHLVRLAEDIGIDKTRASLLLAFVTVGSGFGRVIFGRISDIRRFNRVYIAQIAFLVVGLSNFVVPLTESYAVLAVDAFIFGLFGGCYLIINPVIVCDILGPQKVSYGLGMTFFVIAIPRTLGPLIAGWIYDGLQSYAIAFYSVGATTCLSAILATFVSMMIRKQAEYTIN